MLQTVVAAPTLHRDKTYITEQHHIDNGASTELPLSAFVSSK